MQPEVQRACGLVGRCVRSACAAAWAMGRRARGRRFQQPPQPEGEEDASDGGRKRGQAVGAGTRGVSGGLARAELARGPGSRVSVGACSPVAFLAGLGRWLSRDRKGEQALRALLSGTQDRARGRMGPIHGVTPRTSPSHTENHWVQKVRLLCLF
jgi:hypothetical protein